MSDPKSHKEANAKAQPRKVKDLPGQAPYEGEKVATKDLVGKTFLILKAKRIPSTKKGPGYFYVCQCARPETGALFTTLLGGVAVVGILDQWTQDLDPAPLEATLSEISGGEFGRYYVLE